MIRMKGVITTISNIMFYCQNPKQPGKTTDLPQGGGGGGGGA